MYDYTIVGAGPTGLTIAYFLSKYGYKILLIERESSIGGCHRVTRVNGLFTEHSPRMYFGNYYALQYILKNMNLNFDDIFASYNFNLFSIATEITGILSSNEIYSFIKEYAKFIINQDYAKHINMYDFMKSNNFSEKSINTIDALTRLTDGATINTYTLYEFLSIINQNGLYNLYQPKKPNDVLLFKLWKDVLIKNNVDIQLNSEVVLLDHKDNQIKSIKVSHDNKIINIQCKNLIFAIPPKNLLQILAKNNLNAFGDLPTYSKWAIDNAYIQFIAVTFHWKTKLNIKNKYVIPNTDWLIAHIVLSNYMDFEDERSQTVISACITKKDSVSSYINKTPDECNEKELVDEVFRQLNVDLNLPPPDYSLLNPHIYKQNNTWTLNDGAFVFTNNYKNSKSTQFNNLYSVGTQNGNSDYAFTTMESAIGNGISFVDEIANTKNLYGQIITVNYVIMVTILFLVIIAKII